MTSVTPPGTDSAAADPNDAQEMAKFGIRRVAVSYFHYGAFRYTNLADALAEARRQAIRSEQRNLDGRPTS